MNIFFKTTFLTFWAICVISLFTNVIASDLELTLEPDLNPPHLNRIWVQGNPLKTDSLVTSVTEINLPFDKNFLTVEFISINYKNQHTLQYAYQLVGIDSNWVYSGNQRRASYANLGSGVYPLRLKVSNDGFHWVQNTQPVKVVVTPPFWAGVWYQVLLILFIFFILWIIYKVRVNAAINQVLEIAEIRKKESETLRLMMAQDFHDEMGNKLASIIVLVSTLQLLIKDKSKEVQKSLARIEKSSKQLFDGTKSFIWSINPESDQLGAAISYINNFGSELFEHTPISFVVEDELMVNDKLKKLTVGYSRQLFFIMKEAMTNALVHSKAKQIKLGYCVDNDTQLFCVTLEDDGNGVSEKQLSSSRGLKNMKTRADRIGYSLTYFHNPTGGFGVRLEGEFPKR